MWLAKVTFSSSEPANSKPQARRAMSRMSEPESPPLLNNVVPPTIVIWFLNRATPASYSTQMEAFTSTTRPMVKPVVRPCFWTTRFRWAVRVPAGAPTVQMSARTREVGTLRALGFSRQAILFTFVVESAFLALVGGALGCLLAFTVHGYSTGTANLQSFSEVAYAFRITPRIVASGLSFALVLGVAGGLLPALRAARLPIAGAVREA